MVAEALSPRLVTWVLRKAGVYEFYRQVAVQNAARGSEVGAVSK